MRYCRDEHMVLAYAIKDGEGEAIEHKAMFATSSLWISVRSFHDPVEGVRDFKRKRLCRGRGERAWLGPLPTESF